MTTVQRLTDLTAVTTPAVDWSWHGWETSSANARGIVLYVFNQGAAYSDDGGATFTAIDANGLCQAHGATLIGDQVVMYSPYLEKFVWVILTTAQDMVLAVASPDEVAASGGTAWVSWLIPASSFGDGRSLFDRPTVACGFNFTYVAVNLGPISIAMRIPNSEIAEAQPLHVRWFQAVGLFWLRATENAGDTGHFAALSYVHVPVLEKDYVLNVRVFERPENANGPTYFDVPIAAVPTEGGIVDVPSGQWLANGRGSLQVLGITRRADELWLAWWANRTVKDGPGLHEFPQPHIEIAVVDLATRSLKTQLYMWNPDVAFVFPDLAVDSQGNIGLSFCWGGPRHEPQVGIGVLTWPVTWPVTNHLSMTSSPSLAAGGDYITIRRSFSPGSGFCAAGFTQDPPASAPTNHPRYILFSA